MTFPHKPIPDEELTTRLLQPLIEEDGFAEAGPSADLHGLQAALKRYQVETLQWAERRSAGQPSLAGRAHKQERWAALPRWSLALVAVVTIAGGVAHLASTRASMESTPATPDVLRADERSPMPSDLDADNQLLSSIDAELSYHARSPVDSLDLRGKQADPVAATEPGVTD